MSIAWNASTPEMDDLFSTQREVQAWLDFEAGLARAQARHGLVPAPAAAEITAKARVELLDLERLAEEIRFSVHPIMPMVRMLATLCDDGHGEYVHWGATTQDVLDTGLVLRLSQADALITRDLKVLTESLRRRAMEHRDTPMAGRTHGQHAVPITLGYKLAVWVDELQRHLATLNSIRAQTMVGQFGGAAGTLSSLGLVGLDVRASLMAELDLGEPAITWHVARDRITHYAVVLAMIASSIQRLGLEIVTLQRDEIGEVFEPFHYGKVCSSTMPHKRNPSMSESLVTLGEIVKNDVRTAFSALGSLHERDKAVFSAETDYVPRICSLTHRMIVLATTVVDGLEVDAARMQANLDVSRGQVFSERVLMALSERMGRQQAHEVLYDIAMSAFEANLHLREALQQSEVVMTHLTGADLDALFDLREINAAASALVERICQPGREHSVAID